jgi:hypothetical protein
MRSYTEELTTYQNLSLNSGSANTTFFNTIYNDAVRTRLGSWDWKFLQKSGTGVTTAGSRVVQLPPNCEKVRGVMVTSGSTKYTPALVVNQNDWQRLITTSYSSDIPTHVRVVGDTLEFNPIFITSSLVVTFDFKKKVVDISTADYTTGTISITSGTTVVTGSGTTFTAAMVGRYLKTTDGLWYEIATFTSTTVIGLTKAYAGSTISGATYAIGQMSVFPDGFENIPIYDTLSMYYETQKVDNVRAASQKARADEMMKIMKQEWSGGMVSSSLDVEINVSNPNLYLNL